MTPPHAPGTPFHLSLSQVQAVISFFTEPTREQTVAPRLQVCPAGPERGKRCPAPLPRGILRAAASPLRAEPRGRPLCGLPRLQHPWPARRAEPGGEQPSLRAAPAGRPAATGRRRVPVLPPPLWVFTAASLAARRRPGAPRRGLSAGPAGRRLRAGCGGPPRREQRGTAGQSRAERGKAELRGAQPAQRSPAPAAPAAKTPRFLYRAKGGCRSAKMGRQTAAGGRAMQRSQSRSSLSASFEALAVYFPCMNSLEEEDGGEGPGVGDGRGAGWGTRVMASGLG